MKNEITIREYKSSDYKSLVEFMEELQDYLVGIDPLKSIIKWKKYGEIYSKDLLKKIKKNNGIIYFAEYKNKPVGCIAGNYLKPSLIERISNKVAMEGSVLELFVEPEFRNKQIGRMLIKKLEEYFKKKKCRLSTVAVFYPNKNAYDFYKKGGYDERMIHMIKKI